MPSINQLDAATISKIAAGEVVERPLSVVRELIENSIDAGSTEIVVTLEDGGHRLISVSDNGSGMSMEDAALCLKSHSTSKLGDIEDLEHILTLGFRGEALHSIGAVARLSLTTSDGAGDVAWKVRMEGGAEYPPEPAARTKGATVEVENLFYNVPARRKFLKSARSEIMSVNSMMTNYIIGRPAIGFELINNGETILKVAPGEDHIDRIEYVMGKNIASEIVHMTATMRHLSLDAYFTMPDMTFPVRKYQFFFINGRSIKDRNMTVAVDTAYKGIVPPGRFAMAALFVDLPSSMVDVNVHPTKTEVRFANAHEIHSLIYRTLRGRFVKTEEETEPGKLRLIPPSGFTSAKNTGQVEDDLADIFAKKKPVQGEVDFFRGDGAGRADFPGAGNTDRNPEGAGYADSGTAKVGGAGDSDSDPALDSDEPFRDDSVSASDGRDAEAGRGLSSRFTILGQFFETFIMVKIDGAPVFIDQHVASERIIYNQLRRKNLERHAQLLLLSQPVEVPRDVFDTLNSNLEKVRKTGLEIEPFGDRAFVIRSVVHNAGPFDPLALLVSIAEEIKATPYKAPEEAMLDRLLTVAACRMAVKAGQKLSSEEMALLVEQLLREEYNRTCPHGRPIIYSISQDMLNTWFRR